jgi:hypothetical protein
MVSASDYLRQQQGFELNATMNAIAGARAETAFDRMGGNRRELPHLQDNLADFN